jgi:hypothetical protein
MAICAQRLAPQIREVDTVAMPSRGMGGMANNRPAGQTGTAMALWWLSYRRSGEVAGIAIVEAQSLTHARLRAALDGLDQDATFAEGHRLDGKLSALVTPLEIGRFLPLRAALRIIERFEGKR